MSGTPTAEEPRARRSWRRALAVYTTRRQVVIFLMGFSSGLPLLLGFSTLSWWMRSVGVDLTTIGVFALVATLYAFKFLWAPVIDHLWLPLLSRLFGRRRGWLLLIQAMLMLAILSLGQTDPVAAPLHTALLALVVAFLSASQDIVVDAYRIEVLAEPEQGAGAAMTQAGYRFGLLAAGAGALYLSDFLAWSTIYAIMASLVLIGVAAVLLGPEPPPPPVPAGDPGRTRAERIGRRLEHAVLHPLLDFTRRPGWLVILLFVLLYKYGDAVAGIMANPFYLDLGFSGAEVAGATKVFGVVATLAGVFAGGLMVARIGVLPALLLGGVLQAVTNLIFAWLAARGHDLPLLYLAVGADSFTGGLGSSAFVAFLSGLCNVAFTGTQYALLTSLMAFGRTALSSLAGVMADETGWLLFFVGTTGLALPGLLLLLWIRRIYDSLPASASSRSTA